MSYREYEKLEVSDTEEDLFASPSRSPRPSRQAPQASIKQAAVKDEASSSTQNPSSHPFKESKYDAEASREEALKKELDSLKHMNEVIEGVIASLTIAKSNMGTVNTTVGSASALLNTWTRIMSQTEHNQRLILNPGWKGASRDAVEAENEVIMRKQAEERRVAEEERRRAEARQKAEDEERARQAGTDRPTRGTRGGRTRGRVASSGYGRTTSSTSSGYVGVGGQNTGMQRSLSQGRRGGNSIGRGIPGSSRGSTRGSLR